MRVAVIVVSMFVVATPSHASNDCMSKAEARQHFGSVHIYWHGPEHCWDASPGRHRVAQRSRHNSDRHAQREDHPAKWREALSELLPVNASAQAPETSISDPYDVSDATAPRTDWQDRWVDVVQVVPPTASSRKPEAVSASPTIERRHEQEPLVSASSVVLVFLGLTLTVVIVEVLFRSTVYERRR